MIHRAAYYSVRLLLFEFDVLPMIRDVLVPMDDSEMSKRALRYALEVFEDADITVVHVAYLDIQNSSYFNLTGTTPEEINQEAREYADSIFSSAKSISNEYNADIETEFLTGNVSNTIVSYAEEQEVDQIVVGTHGREAASRILLGSVAEKVARRSHAPTTIVR